MTGNPPLEVQLLQELNRKIDELASRPNYTPGFLKGDVAAAHFCGMKRAAFRKWVEQERVPVKEINGIRYFKLTILERRMTPAAARQEEAI